MAVQVICQFELPVPPHQVWTALKDVSRVATCFPGVSQIRPLDEQSCEGTVTVKLGPMQLEFQGNFSYVHLDEAQMSAQARAAGQDRRGRGSATSMITLDVSATDGGSRTTVKADTELVGTVAQFGRAKSLIQSVAETLIGDFANRLGQSLSPQRVPAGPASGAADGTEPRAQSQDARPGASAAPPTPLSGIGLMVRVLANWWRGLFGHR